MFFDAEDMIVEFRNEKDAAHFNHVWNRDPLIFPTKCGKNFAKAHSLVRDFILIGRVGWVPESVFFCNLYSSHTTHPSQIIGGRRHYRPSLKLYFFEFETDAFIHWIELYGAGYH